MMYNNPWKQNNFKTQSASLTFSPAFLAAALYIMLSRIVTILGPKKSRLPAVWYPRIFISCDIFGLLVQVAGILIVISSDNPGDRTFNTGKSILIAGLVAQVLTSLIFILLAIDFGVRIWRQNHNLDSVDSDSQDKHTRSSSLFHGFLVALSISTLTIFVRTIFRLAELSNGFESSIARTERLFIALEGVMIAIAVVVLNVFHPGVCFKEGYDKNVSIEMKSDGQRAANAMTA